MQQGRDHGIEVRLAVGQGRDHGLAAAVLCQCAEQPVKAAQQVRTAGNDQGKNSRDHSTLFDVVFTLDGVELMYHLRQSPCAERSQYYNTQQVQRVGTEYGVQGVGLSVDFNLSQCSQSRSQTALILNGTDHNSGDADEHNNALNEVVDRSCRVAAQNDIDRGQQCHDNNDDFIGTL